MIGEILVSFVLVWFAWYVISTSIRRRNMPPGPFPFPFVGNLPHLSSDPLDPFGKLSEKYGDIITVTFPTGCTVILNSATLVREARLGKQDALSGKSPQSLYPWTEIFGKDLITADFSPSFQFRRRVFKSAMHVFGAGIEQALERARHAVDTAIEEIEEKKRQPFSPKDLFESSILVQLWEWLTSKTVALDDPCIKSLSKFEELVAKQAVMSNLYQAIPFLSYLPTQFNRDIKHAKKIKDVIFLEEYRAQKETYTPGVIRNLTDSFISSYEKEIAKETTKEIGSMEDVAGLMTDVTFAGSDTTSSSLAWLFLYMVRHPDVQEKIHEELDNVVGSERLPRWKDAQNLPYLQATICEAQRACGLLTLIGSNAIKDITVAGYNIPKGTFVAYNSSTLHRDEREWPEPEKFKPERFLDSDGKFVGWTKLNGFVPFGIGRRECPGQLLAKIMIFIFASTLLHCYKIEVPEGEGIPTTKVATPQQVVRPEDFKVIAKKRNGLKE